MLDGFLSKSILLAVVVFCQVSAEQNMITLDGVDMAQLPPPPNEDKPTHEGETSTQTNKKKRPRAVRTGEQQKQKDLGETGMQQQQYFCEAHLKSSFWAKFQTLVGPLPDICCSLSLYHFALSTKTSAHSNTRGASDASTKMATIEATEDEAMKAVLDMVKAAADETGALDMDSMLDELLKVKRERDCNTESDKIEKFQCLLSRVSVEAASACYCHYRANLGCNYEQDCNERDKTNYLDYKFATNSLGPYSLCNQVPHGGTFGEPYNKCMGYCLLANT